MADSTDDRAKETLARYTDGERDFRRLALINADLSLANLSGANLSEANFLTANFSGANLSKADLSKADLSGANLRGANLRGANLMDADLGATILGGADLSEAILIHADLHGAYLSGAKFSRANLSEAILSGANLSGTNFHGAICSYTAFDNLDLRPTVGLEEIIHAGPSTIGIDTLYESHGEIPEAFMRGCGVPDEFITFARSLVGAAIEFYSCFISYSTKDREFAKRLHADLQANNVRCWFAPEDVQGGKKLHAQIDDAIRTHDKLLLLLSEHSMNSPWVHTEIRRARKQEAIRGKRVLFPLRLCSFESIRDWECFDADTGKDLAVETREYFVPDFSCWQDHSKYKLAFDRLLRDLKTPAPVP
jgi:uncharacterized protein YjbI with pentapeptide repeats